MFDFTILTENSTYKLELRAEHGLSLWIKKDGKSILFDTGTTSVFLKNAKKLGILLESANAMIISHGHLDHAGGFPYFPFEKSNAKVYMSPYALNQKIAIKDGSVIIIGDDLDAKMHFTLIDHYNKMKSRFELGDGTREIFPHVYLVGSIGYYNSFLTISENSYVVRDGCQIKDPMDDEQLLVIEEDDGLAVFSGCSHKGIINCVEHVKTQFPGKKINTLVAGMHILGASYDIIDETIKYFMKSNIDRIIPLHCTGIDAIVMLKNALGDRCQLHSTGDKIIIG